MSISCRGETWYVRHCLIGRHMFVAVILGGLISCASHSIIEKDFYPDGIVGVWTEKGRYSSTLELRPDGSYSYYYPYLGGCIVFDPAVGTWTLVGQTLILSQSTPAVGEDIQPERLKILMLSRKKMLFRYENALKSNTFYKLKD